MSYKAHNLKRGDVICEPPGLCPRYSVDTDTDNSDEFYAQEYDRWRILWCRPTIDENDYWVGAKSLTTGKKYSWVVQDGWNLCVDEYAPPTLRQRLNSLKWKIKHAVLIRTSAAYRAKHAEMLRNMQLLNSALAAGTQLGSPLKVESLEPVMSCVTFNDDRAKLKS